MDRKQYKQEYYQANKERLKRYQLNYYQTNKERIREYQKEYYKKNREHLLIYNRRYYKKHPEKSRGYSKTYRRKFKARNPPEPIKFKRMNIFQQLMFDGKIPHNAEDFLRGCRIIDLPDKEEMESKPMPRSKPKITKSREIKRKKR